MYKPISQFRAMGDLFMALPDSVCKKWSAVEIEEMSVSKLNNYQFIFCEIIQVSSNTKKLKNQGTSKPRGDKAKKRRDKAKAHLQNASR